MKGFGSNAVAGGRGMKRKRLALYTFAVLREPAEHPANQGFHDRNDRNLLAAELSEGFIARSGYCGEPGPESWGEQVFPRFYIERGDGWSPSTLSLWEDLISPMAFSYGGLHAEAMRHAREWFLKPAWPPYVLWWVERDHMPTWAEAVARHEFLHERNPSLHAFDFKNPFDEEGHPAIVDCEALRLKMRLNEERQRPLT
jgi:hypothetical protein